MYRQIFPGTVVLAVNQMHCFYGMCLTLAHVFYLGIFGLSRIFSSCLEHFNPYISIALTGVDVIYVSFA